MKVEISEIKKILVLSLTKRGLSNNEARLVAEEYLTGELEGKTTHGLIAFPLLVENKTSLKSDQPWKIIRETPSLVYVNGNKNIGQLVVDFTIKKIFKKIKKTGVVLSALYNITPILRPGSIARNLAEKDLVSLIFENGGKNMISPPGGIDPVVGTNPVGMGIPTSKNPIIIDMASSKMAWGFIRLAKELGKKLPPDTYLDKNGNFTLNPDDVYSVIPMAGYKGFSLALAIEIFTGSLLNSSMGIMPKTPYHTPNRGLIIIAIDPSFFTDVDKFKNENSKLLEIIKKSRKIKNAKEILIPGERARKSLQASIKKGYLEIEESLYQKLISLKN